MPSATQELVTVASYWDPMEAQIARLRLAHEEIPAFLEKEFTVLTAWHFTNAIGGIRLNVPAPRYDEARSILASKVAFADWADTGCWELRLDGQAVLPTEEPDAIARQRQYDLPLTERELLAQRALRAAVLGTTWMTPLLFACAQVVRFYAARGRCRLSYRRQAKVAALLAAAMLSLVIVVISWLASEPHYVHYTVERREQIYQAPFRP